MIKDKKNIGLILVFIPALTVVWSMILNHLSGPYFISRIDPEYVYLLNGMNVSLLEFDRIGHVDHPGTPFQLLTGVFIRLIYWISGNGSLTDDVITEPEKYLSWSSFFLSLIMAWLIYWISSLEFKRSKNLLGAIIIPVSLFFYTVIIDLPSRYIPDRLLMITVLVFSGICMKYFYLGYPQKKFAILSGLLMALGIVTKINFIPFIILPFLLIKGLKGKLFYSISLILSCVIFFLPVYDKFDHFWQFAIQISTHDSLYGSGNEQILNLESFIKNLFLILKGNPAFVFILAIAIAFTFYFLFKPSTRKKHTTEFSFFIGFVIVSIFSVLLVAKHYKNYYLVPIVSMSGLVLYIAWIAGSALKWKKSFSIAIILMAVVFIGVAIKTLIPAYQNRNVVVQQELLTQTFFQNTISPQDYIFIEPSWMAGPIVSNGLVYGNSYIAKRIYFYNDYEKKYPNVLTFEGLDKPMKFMRMIDADNESIFKSGKDIFVLSTPGRNAEMLCDYLDSCAQVFEIDLFCEPVFENNTLRTQILRLQNRSNWFIFDQGSCGFERERNKVMFTDDEQTILDGSFRLTSKTNSNGRNAIVLDSGLVQSPKYFLNNVNKGDYLQLSIKRRKGKNPDRGRLIVDYTSSDLEQVTIAEEEKLSTINRRWELVRLNFTIEVQPIDSTLTCFYEYTGDEALIIDDFDFKIFSKQKKSMK